VRAGDQFEARKRQAVAEQQLKERLAAIDQRLDATDGRLAAFKELQTWCYTEAVLRMVEFLRRHDKQVREIDRLLVDGIKVPFPLECGPGEWLRVR